MKASDVEGDVLTRVTGMREADLNGEDKLVLVTEEGDIVMNKTNLTSLADAFGPESDNWVGQAIFIRSEKTNFSGKRVDCLRVYPAPEEERPKPVAKFEKRPAIKVFVPKSKPRDIDENIPF